MNGLGTKQIIFNKSTLLSLKAELLKKQEEVNEKKQLPQHKLENFKPPPPKPTVKDDDPKKERKSFKDSFKEIDTEELEACKKSKAILEKKAELYEHLSDSAGISHLSGQFLVDFDTKKKQENGNKNDEEDEDDREDTDIKDQVDDGDSEWTEFTDCLGRTRKCLKIDLEDFKENDRKLMKAMGNYKSALNNDEEIHNEDEKPEKPMLVQKTNDYLQSLREKWEEKERELLAKEKDIHYQDLLFDEARIHGVSYYSFSTDEAERKRQMEELIKQREETLRAQQETQEERRKRDELMAARVAAARARQRARAGLPPEDPKEEKEDFTQRLLQFLTEQKNEADNKAKEEEKKIREEKEKERQKLREAYIREWDVGKEGADGDKVKKFRQMTQEEYVEQQREKRLNEFAPKQSTSTTTYSNSFDNKGKIMSSDPPPPKTWSDVRPNLDKQPIDDANEAMEQKGLYFSTVRKPAINMKFRNFVRAQEPTPIIDEIVGETSEGPQRVPEKRTIHSNETDVAPPPTFEYYGPTPKYARTQKPFESDIRESFEQGTKSLETKTSGVQLSKKYDFTFE